jgi:hypothetical protein
MAAMKHVELRVDGRRDVIVPPPKGYYSSHPSPCAGGLVAYYTGGPLTEKELPTKIVSGDSILTFDSANFHTDRVIDSKLSRPTDPAVCDANGKPTKPTSAPSFPADALLPTPSYPPIQVNPTHT